MVVMEEMSEGFMFFLVQEEIQFYLYYLFLHFSTNYFVLLVGIKLKKNSRGL